MPENYAEIEVDGPAAKHIANSVIGSLGVGATDVSEIEVELTTANGAETTTSFHSDGPHAGRVARQMIGNLDHDETPPTSIAVRLRTGADADTEPVGGGGGGGGEADTTTTTGGSSGEQAAASDGGERSREQLQNMRKGREGVSAAQSKKSGQIERHIAEPRVDEPQDISPGTRHHEVLWTLAQWGADPETSEWVTASDLYEYTSFDFPSVEAFGTPLGQTFLDFARCERRQTNLPGGGAAQEYRITDAGREEIDRLGDPRDVE